MVVFLLTLLELIVVVSTVAPGDEEPLCDDLRVSGTIPTPDYDPTMRVLMDTWNYNNLLPVRSGSVWEQVDNDNNNPVGTTSNWIQNSNNACRQTVQVCGFAAGVQDNWLITQLINRTVNGTRLSQVSVIIEFELQGCDITLNCQRTFNTHVYERSSENTAASKTISNYRQVQRVSPDDTSGNRVNETVNIDFASTSQESSFYFAVQDETSCIVVTRMIVFHHVCPQQTSDLIHYPETIAPNSGIISVTASCVENAATENGGGPRVICSSGGVWSNPSLGIMCTCLPGYINQDGKCFACPRGTYLSPSNGSCSACPANSVSEREGLSQCTCVDGYYRAPQGEEDLPCYLSAAARVPIEVIITVPTILLVLIVIATSIIVITVIKIRKKEVEEYYSEVGPPPLPMRMERNTSHQQGLQTFPVLNVGGHGQNPAAHIATTLVDENSLKTKQATTTPDNPANVANELYTVTTTENTAYQANELDVTLTENTAYGATVVTVTTSKNPAYGATQVTVTTSENLAYGATEVTVTTSENPAYITNFTDLSNGNDTET